MKTLSILSVVCAWLAFSGCAPADVDVRVESNDDSHDGIEYINSGKILPPGLPFSESVRVNETVYVSGLIGIKPGTMKLVEGGLVPEAKQTMDNIKAALEAAGYTLDDVVKVTVFLADMNDWAAFNDVYKTYFTKNLPARSALGANGLALGARVEVECTAAKDE